VTLVLTIVVVVIPSKLVLSFLLPVDCRLSGRVGYIISSDAFTVENSEDCLLLATAGVSVVSLTVYPAIKTLYWLRVLPFVTSSENTRSSMQILFLHVLFPLLLRGPTFDVGDRAGRVWWKNVVAFYITLFLVYTLLIGVPVTLGRRLVSDEDDALAFVGGASLLYMFIHARNIWHIVRTKMVDFLSFIALASYVLGVLPLVLGHGFMAVTNQQSAEATANSAWLTGLLVGKTGLIFAFLWISEEEERIFLAFTEQPLDRHIHGRIILATWPLISSYALHVLLPTLIEYFTGVPDVVKIFTPTSVLGMLTYKKLLPTSVQTWTRVTKHVFDRRYLLKTQLVNYRTHNSLIN
jgi:hypothetical protein